MEKVKWNKHFFQFTVPEKKMKKKNAKVKFVGNGNQSEEKNRRRATVFES